MPLKVEYNDETEVLEATVSGAISLEEICTLVKEGFTLTQKHNANKFLSNISNAILDISVFKVLKLEEIQVKEKLSKDVKIAMVEPIDTKSKEFADFYEAAAINRGWNAKVFPNRQLALTWLLDTPDKNTLS